MKVAAAAFAAALVAVPLGTAATPRPALLGISFPEGFSARQMVDRVAAVRRIAIQKRHVTPVLTAKAYAAALGRTRPPASFKPFMHGRSIEGFLFPSLYKFGPADTAARLIALQLHEFERRWTTVTRTVNANPYEVLTVASMVEREAAVPDERPLVAAVIYNRLAKNMPLGIDATLRYGLGVPGTRPLTMAAAPQRLAVQHAPLPRPAADADRQPGSRVAPRRGESRSGRLSLLRPDPEHGAALLHGRLQRVLREGRRVRVRRLLITATARASSCPASS